MASHHVQRIAIASALTATVSAFDFGGGNDITQSAGTVAPGTDMNTAAGVNGFGTFGSPVQSADTPSTDQGLQPTFTGWGSPGGWPQGDGGQQWGQLFDCSGSDEGAGGQTPPTGGFEWGGYAVDCSGSSEGVGGQTPPNSGFEWGGYTVDCSGSNEGGWAPPSGGQQWGSLECSGSDDSAAAQPDSTIGSSEGLSSETGSQGAPQSTAASSNTAAPTTTSETGGTESSSAPVASTSSSGTAYQGPQAVQTSPPATETETSTTSNVGEDADGAGSTYSTPSESSAVSSGTDQGQQVSQTGTGDNDWGCSVAIDGMAQAGQRVVSDTATNCDKTPVTFGKITSKKGGCVVGDPTSYIKPAYLDWVWENRIGPNADTSNTANWNVMANKNWIMDHLVHNNGTMNYCVRWDSKAKKLAKTTAAKFQGMLTRHYNAWNKWLVGYNCWPFEQLSTKVVGFAAREASELQWSGDSLGTIYEGNLDSNGIPQCPDECHRFYDNVNNVWSDTTSCQGEPYDVYLHLNDNIEYGFGYDWGEEVSLKNTLENIDKEHIMFIGHEIGHGFGLPDFYSEADKPARDFPDAVMMAFSAITITPNDGWMLRRVLEHLKPRYGF